MKAIKTIHKIGSRVELHPGTDRWMMGDRFGLVVKHGRKYFHIKMERSGKTITLPPDWVMSLDH